MVGERTGSLLRHFAIAFLLAVVGVLALASPVDAQRIKDFARVEGIRLQQMKGIGLVTGLSGTGDSSRFSLTRKLYSNLLENLDIPISEDDLKSRNIAVVMVEALVPSTTKKGSNIEVSVSSIGDAKSIRGGRLLETTLYGPGTGDKTVYAVAQGPIVGHPDSETVGTGTAILEEDISIPFIPQGDRFRIILHRPDFSTATRVARAINEFPFLRFTLGDDHQIAQAIDSGAIEVRIPPQSRGERAVELISRIMGEVEVPDVDQEAKVVIDRRTRMVTVNGSVRVAPVVVILGDAQISIPGDGARALQHPLLIDVIQALRVEGFSAEQIPEVIRNIHRSGALIGSLEEL